MFGLPTIHKGQVRKKSQKCGQMEVKVEAEQVAKIRNLRNFTDCEILQVTKIRNLAKFLKWPKFLQFVAPVSFRLLMRIFEFVLDSLCLSRLDDVGLFSLYNYKNSHEMR